MASVAETIDDPPLVQSPPVNQATHLAGSTPASQNTGRPVFVDVIWWMNPVLLCCAIIGITCITSFILIFNPEFLELSFTLTFRHSHFIAMVGLQLVLLAAIVVGARGFDARRRQVMLTAQALHRLTKLAHTMTFIVMSAYILWLLSALSKGLSPAVVVGVFTLQGGAQAAFKEAAVPVGGVTTLVQLAPPTVCLWIVLLKAGVREAARPLTALMVATCLRVFLYAERLALIEVVIPAMFVLVAVQVAAYESRLVDVAAMKQRTQHQFQLWKSLLPALIAGIVYVLFMLSEYTRSWQFFKHVYDGPFVQFINSRIIAYYATALNNSGLYYDITFDRPHVAYMSFPALWDAPGLGALMGSNGNEGYEWADWWEGILKEYASAEFNSVGSFLVLRSDLGTLGAIALIAAMGFLLGSAWAMARRGSFASVILVGSLTVGLFELLRFFYWGQGRFLPIFIACILIIRAEAHSKTVIDAEGDTADRPKPASSIAL